MLHLIHDKLIHLKLIKYYFQFNNYKHLFIISWVINDSITNFWIKRKFRNYSENDSILYKCNNKSRFEDESMKNNCFNVNLKSNKTEEFNVQLYNYF